MADNQTNTVLKRRSAAKTGGFALFGGGLGLVLKAAFGFEPADAFFSSLQAVTDWFSGIRLWLDAHPDLRGWLVGPVALGLLFLAVSKSGWFRGGVLDRLFPDPPPFVRSDLDEARSRERMITLEGPSLPFVGREAELVELEELLDMPERVFAWRALTGPSGIGKTRLGIEWLEAAKARGWDVGIVDKNDLAALKAWRARRRTALVIDEARRDWDDSLGETLVALAHAASPKRPVRVLVIDQIEPAPDIPLGSERVAVTDGAIPTLRLRGLVEEDMGKLRAWAGNARFDDATLMRESAGRPRAALIMLHAQDATSYTGALSEWVERFVPGLADEGQELSPSLAGPLMLTTLAGPVMSDVARDLFGTIDTGALVRFYQSETREALQTTLPPLHPDDLAQELLLRLLPRIDLRLRSAALDRMLVDAPAAVEARLSGIWRDCPDLGPDQLNWLQARFDTICAGRVASLREQAAEARRVVSQAAEASGAFDSALATLEDLAATRPFDAEIRLHEAMSAVGAINHYGAGGKFDALERWGKRLTGLAEDRRFAADVEFPRAEAKAAVNAIHHYGGAKQFDALERWGERLIAMVEDERFVADVEIRRLEASGAINAINHYGAEGQFDALERWGKRLLDLVGDERFVDDAEVRRVEAMGAVNAITHYGSEGRFDALERWAKRLIALAENERFATDSEIRLFDAKGAFAAIDGYGRAREFQAVERWGKRLVSLARDEQFVASADYRVEEVKGAVFAMCSYGSVGRFEALERWGKRLIDSVEDERFAANEVIRRWEIMGASDAMGHYSEARQIDGLESWGKRLIAVAEDERFADDMEFRIWDARGSINAIGGYGAVGNFEALEWWGRRLVALAGDGRFAGNVEMRVEEARGAFNAIHLYREAGRHDWPAAGQWRKRLAHLAFAFAGCAEIQDAANKVGLDPSSQRSNNFPYGRPGLMR